VDGRNISRKDGAYAPCAGHDEPLARIAALRYAIRPLPNGARRIFCDFALIVIMPCFMPDIHVFLATDKNKTWMAGTSPAMTSSLALLAAMPGAKDDDFVSFASERVPNHII